MEGLGSVRCSAVSLGPTGQVVTVLWKQSTGYTESGLVERLRMKAEETAEV